MLLLNKVHCMDCLEGLKQLPDNVIDSIVTDPPAGISFMGKDWDTFKPIDNRWKCPDTEQRTGENWNPGTRIGSRSRARRCKVCGRQAWSGNPCKCENPIWEDDTREVRDVFIEWLSSVFVEAKRVLKPGGHAFVWALPRTSHWTAMALEEAGFDVRDCVYHVFGSGFPKSEDVSQAIDKKACREQFIKEFGRKPTKEEFKKAWLSFREVIGKAEFSQPAKSGHHAGLTDSHINYAEEGRFVPNITVPTTPEAKQWEGWGTSLKPATEKWILVQKPLNTVTHIELLCQSKKYVQDAERILRLIQAGLNEGKTHIAVENVPILQEGEAGNQMEIGRAGDSSEQMDISQLTLEMVNSGLSMILSWNELLEEILNEASKFTISTGREMIIDLKILNSLLGQVISKNIIMQREFQANGLNADVLLVENILKSVLIKSRLLNGIIVPENATENRQIKFNENIGSEEIWLVRKPLSEKTVAQNVLKWGVGGLNIDGCRIPYVSNDDREGIKRICLNAIDGEGYRPNLVYGKYKAIPDYTDTSSNKGRFPSHLIYDGSDEVLAEFAKAGESSDGGYPQKTKGLNLINDSGIYGKYNDIQSIRGFSDRGSPARFFYCAKPTKSEREERMGNAEEMQKWLKGGTGTDTSARETIKAKNFHPTVKAIALMEYLIKMITPPKGLVLDMFAGSGSTLIACKYNNYDFIGFEMNPEYVRIAERRLSQMVLKDFGKGGDVNDRRT